MEIIKDSNISFHCQDTLNGVLEPILFGVSPINYFIYIRLYDDGTLFSLPSNVHWHKWFLANNYHNKTNKQRAQVGNTFWSSQKILNEAQREGAELFAIDNRFDIVERNDQGFHEVFGFGGVKENKIVVINPGVNPVKELNKKSLEKVESLLKIKTPRLITVSRFDKRKNHEKIIMALRNLKQKYPNIVYICIGDGDELGNTKDLVKELDLNPQVMFFNNITEDLKNALLAKSDIFVMPSVIHKTSVEGFGIAYIEAAQYGVPSLGGKDGGASDAIEHEKTGLICEGNNLDEIYSTLDSMIENKKYLELGRNAKELASKFYWSNTIEKYKKIL